MRAITIPGRDNTQDWRINYLPDYNRILKKAIETDMSYNHIGDPSFYALVIESGVITTLFANPLSSKSKRVDRVHAIS